MNVRQCCAYAGIGSRETPPAVIEQIKDLAKQFASCSWTLRSGGADGADKAFEEGCDQASGLKEIFLPYKNFNNNPSDLHKPSAEALKIAAKFHPTWNAVLRQHPTVKYMHARNVHQILGENLDCAVQFVVCWTPDGAEKETSRATGGTGQAIRVAVAHNIPVYNLYNEGRYELVKEICECSIMQYSDLFD